jgi:hypothetical protein
VDLTGDALRGGEHPGETSARPEAAPGRVPSALGAMRQLDCEQGQRGDGLPSARDSCATGSLPRGDGTNWRCRHPDHQGVPVRHPQEATVNAV